jgi:hypothetical protein
LAHSSHANLLSPSRTSTLVNRLKHSVIDVFGTGFLSLLILLRVRDKLVLLDNGDGLGEEARV